MNPTDGITEPKRRTTAPGSLLGYVRQVDRAVVHLLRGRTGDDVSLEVLGDGAVSGEDGAVLVEEAKSRIGMGNPLANRAVDFWKTLRNWVDDAESGLLDPGKTVFQLYVSRPFDGEIASRFAEAATHAEADAALNFAWSTLGIDPSAAEPCAHLPHSIQEHVARLVAAHSSLLQEIISRFRIEFGTGEAEKEILQALDVLMISDSARRPLMERLRGWVLGEVVEQLERGRPARISHAQFRAVFIEYRSRLETRAQLLSVASEPSAEDLKRELTRQTYVRQLDLIKVEDEDKIQAVIDYFTASADRVAWAEEARVFAHDLDAFESELRSAWRRTRGKCDIEHRQSDPVDRGTLIYWGCHGYRARLAGLDVPDRFCRGSFHKLANDLSLGWHPDYRRRLTAAEGSNNQQKAPEARTEPNSADPLSA